MTTLANQDALAQRAHSLAANGFNGLRFLTVDSLDTAADPTTASIELVFINKEALSDILTEIAGNPASVTTVFAVQGGQRIRAGKANGQVKVVNATAGTSSDSIALTLAPVGDYSTYTLSLSHSKIDPVFAELEFRFRPGCFHHACADAWDAAEPPPEPPSISYLAKDFDSFKHTMIAAMSDRVPGWKVTSEADFDQVLIELLSTSADELSDYQDRVLAEAYLGSARKRVSLARHARLVDYHIHQGNQASTWLRVEVSAELESNAPLTAWAVASSSGEERITFASRKPYHFHPLLNEMELYSWQGARPHLEVGSTEADFKLPVTTETEVKAMASLIQDGHFPVLLIREHLNPATGTPPGADADKRQILHLLPKSAEAREDPLTAEWCLHLAWQPEDALRHTYCFEIQCPDRGRIERVSLFHGNLLTVHEGQPVGPFTFVEAGSDDGLPGNLTYQRNASAQRYGITIPLPENPLAYLPTPTGGEIAPRSTLVVEVEAPGQAAENWEEQIDLVHSDTAGEDSDHFMVETDEHQHSTIRFGNGVQGRALPDLAKVHASYQMGGGFRGNVGRNTITHFDSTTHPEITACSNPFDVVDGRDPEPASDIIRFAPEAYRARQLRAVTLEDYEGRAEELDIVSGASARYAWTGSWRTVQIAIDPVNAHELSEKQTTKIRRHLEAVRLIGEDLEVRPPRYVPLEIEVVICLKPDFWPEDLAYLLDQEFSATHTPDGRLGFFHPDAWTFGQALHASQISGRVHELEGIDHIKSISIQRFNDKQSGITPQKVEVAANEIILVENDPSSIERGTITFSLKGGRQ